MQIYGFYGYSGTGKSTRAISLSHNMRIPAIIDDGLLIIHGRKIAGTSAKYEVNKMRAIKRAIFFDSDHAREVSAAIEKHQPEKMLLLGTSKEMILKIVDRLGLPQPMEWIRIEDLATDQEIKSALYTRKIEGRHVIPIPKIEVEKNLLSKWILKVQNIFSTESREKIGESTVVFARFQLGKILVHENCIRDIIQGSCRNLPGLVSINKISIGQSVGSISVYVTLQYGSPIQEIARTIQNKILEAFEKVLTYPPYPPEIVVSQLQLDSGTMKMIKGKNK
jgi:hypothetical protein